MTLKVDRIELDLDKFTFAEVEGIVKNMTLGLSGHDGNIPTAYVDYVEHISEMPTSVAFMIYDMGISIADKKVEYIESVLSPSERKELGHVHIDGNNYGVLAFILEH